jgi:isocitrate dehydrogenase kinase/phosphatase
MQNHADLLDVNFWHGVQAEIRKGEVKDFFPYPESLRFCHRFSHDHVLT